MHPELSGSDVTAAGTHFPAPAEVSQSEPPTQSSLVAHDVLHPETSQRYGAQSVVRPSRAVTVCSPSQTLSVRTTHSPRVAPCAIAQRNSLAHSASVVHGALPQSSPAQTYGSQRLVTAAGHAPLPSHAAASVATPEVQLGARQETLAPT